MAIEITDAEILDEVNAALTQTGRKWNTRTWKLVINNGRVSVHIDYSYSVEPGDGTLKWERDTTSVALA